MRNWGFTFVIRPTIDRVHRFLRQNPYELTACEARNMTV